MSILCAPFSGDLVRLVLISLQRNNRRDGNRFGSNLDLKLCRYVVKLDFRSVSGNQHISYGCSFLYQVRNVSYLVYGIFFIYNAAGHRSAVVKL